MVAKLVKNLSSFRFLFVCVQAGTLAFNFDVAGRYAERGTEPIPNRVFLLLVVKELFA